MYNFKRTCLSCGKSWGGRGSTCDSCLITEAITKQTKLLQQSQGSSGGSGYYSDNAEPFPFGAVFSILAVGLVIDAFFGFPASTILWAVIKLIWIVIKMLWELAYIVYYLGLGVWINLLF
jgi:hypothetical protein